MGTGKPQQPAESTEFIEAIARGCDVMLAFRDAHVLSLSDVAARTGLSRQTARRVLLTLEQLGYARRTDEGYALTPRTLELGAECVSALDRWDLAQPHLVRLVEQTGESSSIGMLDGSDVVFMARVAVPKIIALSIRIGTRLPATATSMGRVLLADLSEDQLRATLAKPSTSGVIPRFIWTPDALEASLASIREHGWSISDQLLSIGVRSIAAPLRAPDGRWAAAVNLTVHASETSLETLVQEHLPKLLETAETISAEWEHLAMLPTVEVPAGAER